MKKKLVLLLAAVMAVSVLASGCGEKETNAGSSTAGSAAGESSAVVTEPEVYTADELLASTEYDVKDYVKLGDYKKISVEIDKVFEITEEARLTYANSIISYYPKNVEVDVPVADGHVVNIDYYGQKDGVAFDGGTAAGAMLEIGSDSFIDGFEDGLIGHKKGEEVVLNLTFPEDYHNTDLAGQEVVFEVTINAVYEPTLITYEEITDDYILENFGASQGITTVEAFDKVVDENLKGNLDMAIQDAFLSKLIEQSEITFPEGLIEKRVEETMASYVEQVAYYGMMLDEYLDTYYGQTEEEFRADLAKEMEATLREELVLEALVADLKCEVTSTDFATFVSYFAANYNMSEEDFIEQCGGKEYVMLNYAEYYVALEEAASYVKYTFVEMADDTTEE